MRRLMPYLSGSIVTGLGGFSITAVLILGATRLLPPVRLYDSLGEKT